jgi:Tol biopolymer transport system component
MLEKRPPFCPGSKQFRSAKGRKHSMKTTFPILTLGLALSATPLFGQDYEAVTQTTAGGLPSEGVGDLAMSGDGRYVVFSTLASDVISGDANATWDVFLRDTVLDTTELISMTPAGLVGNSESRYPRVTEDGRYVVFASGASDLVPGDANSAPDIFRYDRSTATMTLISVSDAGLQQNIGHWEPRMCDISDDGRYVAFVTRATNLSGYDYHFSDRDVYWRDTVDETTRLVSISYLGDQRDTGWEPSVSSTGDFVSFTSNSWLIHPDDADSNDDVYLWHNASGMIDLISQGPAGYGGTGGNSSKSTITPDGRYVVFESSCTDLSPLDPTSSTDIYLRDRSAGTTEFVSYNDDGTVYSGSWLMSYQGCTDSSVSADGRYLTWQSSHRYMTKIEATGTYLRDRTEGYTELIQIPRWWWPLASGDGVDSHVSDDGSKVLYADRNGTPEHGSWSKWTGVFRLRDRSKNRVHLSHSSGVWWGASAIVYAEGAEADAPFAVLRSLSHTGFSYGGASFDLSPSYKVAGRGRIDADGKGRWVSPTIPQSAAGVTLFLELAVFNADGSISDSNFTQLKIIG